MRQAPGACRWSESYLWIVRKDAVVKFPYDSAHSDVLGGDVFEDFSLSFKSVFKFMEGVLVIEVNDDGQTPILKICN